MIFCVAPFVSWALVFQSIPSDVIDLADHAQGCFADQHVCGLAADAANHAFYLDGRTTRFAKCEMQSAAPK